MKKILVIHGPNLNLLGTREQEIYGQTTLSEVNQMLTTQAGAQGVTLKFFQSNHEGEIVDCIQKAKEEGVGAILINPAAYTHTSVAIRDALLAVNIPTVEVHLSNIHAREDFRRTSLIASVVKGQVAGFGVQSYALGLEAAVALLKT